MVGHLARMNEKRMPNMMLMYNMETTKKGEEIDQDQNRKKKYTRLKLLAHHERKKGKHEVMNPVEFARNPYYLIVKREWIF